MKTEKMRKQNNLVTKNYLDKKVDAVMDYINHQLQPVNEFRNEFVSFKDEVLKTLDWLVGAFKKFDEEYMVHSQQYLDINEELENHELRIKTLEKKSST